MPVDIGNVLHVLAHELRTPVGIAHGYIRMLLDDRLADPEDRRRALEQTQKALARVSELSQESSRLANWFDEEHGPATEHIALGNLVERVTADAGVNPPLRVRLEGAADAAVPTFDGGALAQAIATLVRVTARELRNQPCTLAARVNGASMVDMLIGGEDRVAALAGGPDAPNAGAASLERGGVGLTLVLAAVVLDAHRAVRWTVDGSRSTVGIRLPLEERAHQ